MEKSEENQENLKNDEEKSNLKGDYLNVASLVFLYILQGIPFGISRAVQILLQNRGVSYKEQAIFSFASYPFMLKILWAPLVDSIYIQKFGRRKSWLIPTQILIGGFMLYLGSFVDEWMGDGEHKKPQIIRLTVVFFCLWFLAATQDICVDGWCLTMLQKRNVGYAATCNSVGLAGGALLGNVVLLVFESKEFCNKHIFKEPRDHGLITLSGYLKFWSLVFITTTILIAIFKKEKSEAIEELKNNPDYGVKKAYPILLKILKLKSVLLLAFISITVSMCFVTVDKVSTLKLIDYGVPKDKIALLAIPLMPLQLILPFIISRFTAGPKPLVFYLKAFPFRLLMTIVIAVFVYFTPKMKDGEDFPTFYYVVIVGIYVIYQFPLRAMFIADMAFYAKISDPLIGGTYMTLLNTLSNIGSGCTQTFTLWLVDIISSRRCVLSHDYQGNTTLTDNKCIDKVEKEICGEKGGVCVTDIDGYYIEVVINVIYAIIWFYFVRKLVYYLSNLPLSEWHVLSKKTEEKEEEIPLKILNK